MAKHYAYNTMTAGVTYTLYEENPSGLNVVKAQVDIAGGANVPNKNLVTPLGVVTEITDDQLDILKQIPLFHEHVKNGFLVIQKRKDDVEAVVPDMVSRDDSAPLTPNDFVDGDGKAKPIIKDTNADD